MSNSQPCHGHWSRRFGPARVAARAVRVDEPQQVAGAERAALVRAAVTEREVLAVDEEDAYLPPGDGHELVATRLDLALLGDHVLHRP